MKILETKEVLTALSSASASRHDWHGGKPMEEAGSGEWASGVYPKGGSDGK
jgi:hypothetical protein